MPTNVKYSFYFSNILPINLAINYFYLVFYPILIRNQSYQLNELVMYNI